jgi:hypothetical protein
MRKFSPHLYKKDWYYEMSEQDEKDAICLRLMDSCYLVRYDVTSFLGAICNAKMAGCSVISTHSTYKIKRRQFIIRFRTRNMVKCNKDVLPEFQVQVLICTGDSGSDPERAPYR